MAVSKRSLFTLMFILGTEFIFCISQRGFATIIYGGGGIKFVISQNAFMKL